MQSLDSQRQSFILASGRFLAFPLAGAIVWLTVGVASLALPPITGVYVLVFGTGAIFPLALLLAKATKQQVFQPGNQFASLMGLSVLMVNLLWALHFILAPRLPSIVPLSIALALGLHWIVFGWIIRSPLGLVHAIARTVLCSTAFLMFPANQIASVAFAVVLCYAFTIFQLLAFFRKEEQANKASGP